MAKPSLQETVLREHCKSSPSAAQALDELLSQLATLRLVSNTAESRNDALDLSADERRVLDRVVRTRFARASDVARDLELDPSQALITLRSLKNKALLGEERSLSDLMSIYYLTEDGLVAGRRASRSR